MNYNNNNRGSRFGRSRSNRSSFSRFPQNNNNRMGRSTWSEEDLVRTIQYSRTEQTGKEEPKYVATNTFEDFNICEELKVNIRNKGYKIPSPIQDQSIPHILEGKDLIGKAHTGTGKTAAFLIPLIDKSFKDSSQRFLIITPTRELAEQIENEFKELSKNMGLYSALAIGGTNVGKQMRDLRKDPDFVIGTPGRLKDMTERRILDLSLFNNVTLDETDRMVDIGFIKEIKFFISQLPTERQSLFFSATISPKIEEIIEQFVKDPVTISVKKQENNSNIHQDVIRVSRTQNKIDALHDLLNRKEFEKVIVFGNTKWGIQKLSDELVKRGFNAEAIHGNKTQSQRQRTLEKFKSNHTNVLLATDVAARGLDIHNVSHVINYELPKSYDEYTHRIGRTGRADKKGIALTFIGA